MAQGHWQIYNWGAKEAGKREGRSEAIHVEFVPPSVIELALRASAIIGDGFYGVDIKEVGNRLLVIEVNDNPSVDAGVEDDALGMELYRRVARSFRRRIQLARA
jgi:glutathione synthase/RimK-type ligase-like ATP-grasp enzyme